MGRVASAAASHRGRPDAGGSYLGVNWTGYGNVVQAMLGGQLREWPSWADFAEDVESQSEAPPPQPQWANRDQGR